MTLTAPLADVDVAEAERSKGRPSAWASRAAAGSSASRSSSSSCIWLIPAAGVLITSFRPEAARRHDRLVDGARRTRSRTAQWTLENYQQALDAGGLPERVPQQPRGRHPVDRHPDHHRRLRRLRVLVDGVPRPRRAVRARRRPAGRAAADGADPDPAALHRRAPSSVGVQVIPDLDLNGTFLGVWLAHTAFGLPLATYLLRNYIGSLPSSIIESAKIDGADHFTIFWRLVVPLSVPALAAFAIFQFLWVWNDLLVAYVFLGGTPRQPGRHDRPRQPRRLPRRELAPAHRGRVHLDGPPAHRVLLAAALLRARPHRRLGEGLSHG